jgi:very-short-patch-repair endonuclease
MMVQVILTERQQMKQSKAHDRIRKVFLNLGIVDIPPYQENYDYEKLTKHLKTRYLKKIITHNTFDSWDSLEIHINKNKALGCAMKEEKMILLYGEQEGRRRWEEYKHKQAITNTFEYKNKKYGMTREKFDEFNKKRAVTKENLIARHGSEKGLLIWKNYIERQSYTNSKEYLGNRYEDVNKRKGHNVENYIKKYNLNEEQAIKKLEHFFSASSNKFHSKDSQDLFWKVYNNLTDSEKKKTYFAELNNEYSVFCEKKNGVYLYDFVCSGLQLCIEYHGDHYHGNPKLYRPSQFLRGRGQSKVKACEVWKRDKLKNNAIEEKRNYDVLIVWENDWKKNPEEILSKIIGVVYEKRAVHG